MSTIKTDKLLFILSILLPMFLLNFTPKVLSYTEDDARHTVSSAQQKLINCYEEAVKAEIAGANVIELTTTLNKAGDLYSKATLAFKHGDYDSAVRLANQCVNSLEDFVDKASILHDEALEAQHRDFIFLVCTSIGSIAVIFVGFAVWNLLKRKYSSGKIRVNPKDYQVLFLMVIFVSALILASPALSRVLVYPRTEFFTELWILDSNHKAENYPFNVSSNQENSIYLGVANHLGYCSYYVVQVKFRNETQPLPTSFGPIEERLPSSLPPLYNLTFFVADEHVEERLVTFSINYAVNNESTKVNLQSIKLGDVTIGLSNYVVTWNSTRKGFYGFLFFELWLYDKTGGSFKYQGRFVGLWLNMTVQSFRH